VMLPRFSPQADLHWGALIAVSAALAVYVWLFWTPGGYRARLIGQNERAARAGRIPAGRVQMGAMALSGALCGLAGGVELAGTAGQLGTSFSQQWGFLAIPVALLAGLHPLAVVASAVFFGALFAGSDNLSRFTASGATLVYVIQAVAVLGYVGLEAWTRRSRRWVEAA